MRQTSYIRNLLKRIEVIQIKKKTWLVYLVSTCEMGSEGWSGWMYHSVAFGNTDEEIYNIAKGDIYVAARDLIDRANQNGGVDNITVIILVNN